MSTSQVVEQDERTEAVAGESARLITLFLLLALPVDMAYHLLVRHETAWDLVVMYLGAVVIATAYQVRQKTLGRSYWVMFAWIAAVTFITVAVVGATTGSAVWVMLCGGVASGVTAAVVAAVRQAR